MKIEATSVLATLVISHSCGHFSWQQMKHFFIYGMNQMVLMSRSLASYILRKITFFFEKLLRPIWTPKPKNQNHKNTLLCNYNMSSGNFIDRSNIFSEWTVLIACLKIEKNSKDTFRNISAMLSNLIEENPFKSILPWQGKSLFLTHLGIPSPSIYVA